MKLNKSKTNIKIDLGNGPSDLLFQKYIDRTKCEELDELEKNGGDQYIFKQNSGTNLENGLSDQQVLQMRQQYGNNIRETPLAPSMFIAGIASIGISAVSTENSDELKYSWVEGFSIFVSVIIVGIIQVISDWNRRKQLDYIEENKYKFKKSIVLRQGKEIIIPLNEIVVGDIVILHDGMEVPADGILISGFDILADESSITGESTQIYKNTYDECMRIKPNIIQQQGNHLVETDIPSNCVISGSKIISGEGKMMALRVGYNSCVGNAIRVARLVKDETILQQKLKGMLRLIEIIGFYLTLIIFGVLLLRFIIERAHTEFFDFAQHFREFLRILVLVMTLFVVLIPEGLPASITLALTFSSKVMLTQGNYVRKVDGCETMGSVDVLCTDKTGTLTENKFQVVSFLNERLMDFNQNVFDMNAFGSSEYIKLFSEALAMDTNAQLLTEQEQMGSKIEIGLLQFLKKLDQDPQKIRESFYQKRNQIIKFPFSSSRKRMGIIYPTIDSKLRLVEKGGSEIILQTCSHILTQHCEIKPLEQSNKSIIMDNLLQMSKESRVIGLAYKDVSNVANLREKSTNSDIYKIENDQFILIGFIGLQDQIRSDAINCIKKCEMAGIKIKMITGDSVETAKKVATTCGILQQGSTNQQDNQIIEGSKFRELVGGVICKLCKTEKCNCEYDLEDAIRFNRPLRKDEIKNRQGFMQIYNTVKIIARASPMDKYSYVVGLRQRGNIVAVTGDGTNDAPALKKADVGLALGSGTDLAKDSSSIIILQDKFDQILQAVFWGRTIQESVKRFIQFQLTVSFTVMLCSLVCAMVLRQQFLWPVQLLWLNLIMDSFAAIALSTDYPDEQACLQRGPYKREEKIITGIMWKHIIMQTIFQFIVMMVLIFAGTDILPEYKDDMDSEEGFQAIGKYNGDHVACGFLKKSDRDEEDYSRFIEKYGPSRHFTIIFNTFIFLQIFNFFPCKCVNDELNFFKNVFKGYIFWIIIVFVSFIQVIFVEFSYRALECFRYGLTWQQWLICIIIGLTGWIISIIGRVLPLGR